MHTAADVHTEPILIPQVYPVGDRKGLYVLSLCMYPAFFMPLRPNQLSERKNYHEKPEERQQVRIRRYFPSPRLHLLSLPPGIRNPCSRRQ